MSNSKFNLYNQTTKPDVMPVYSTVQSAPIEKKRKKSNQVTKRSIQGFSRGIIYLHYPGFGDESHLECSYPRLWHRITHELNIHDILEYFLPNPLIKTDVLAF